MTTSHLSLSQQLLIGELVRRAAHRAPGKEAFVDGENRLTFRQLEHRVLQVAGWLQCQKIGYGDKVGFILRNGLPFVEIFFGVSLTGAVGVPINFRLAAEEMEYIINHSDSKILVIDREYVPMIAAIRDRLTKVEQVVVVDGDGGDVPYADIFHEAREFMPEPRLTDDDPCMIVYTSGTTGRPKGAVLTHKNLFQNAMNMAWEFRLGPDYKQLIVPPLFHVAAMSTLIINCLVTGTTVIHREFDPARILETVEKEQINYLFLVPAMWNFLFQVPNIGDYDLSSMRICVTGAAICPVEVKKKILQHFPNAGIYDVFGQTEMSPCTTCLHPEDSLRKTLSVGKPVINVEVRIVDDQMRDVPVGEVGEIVYRGPTVMKEYYKNPEATEEAFRDGWFHSGDLVRMDEEGFLYVVDRKKDMIISGGENIYPAEIEEVLYFHPDVLEAAVIGVPDETWGETVKAVIVPKPGKNPTAEEIVAHCARHLASYKKPRIVEFVESLPRNAAGKVLKQVLRERHAQSGDKH